MSTPTERVLLWNSFFHEAWTGARRLGELQTGLPSSAVFDPKGGRLSDEQQAVLTTLALCTLCIEARANHHIAELVEKGILSPNEGAAAERLRPLDKWLLLPRLAGKRRRLDTSRHPHQAVAEICRRRNDLVHVRFDTLTSLLPPGKKMLTLFRGFVEAMEDMNVVLGRIRRPRARVLKIGRFDR